MLFVSVTWDELEALHLQYVVLSDHTGPDYGISRSTFLACLGSVGRIKNLWVDRIWQVHIELLD